MKWHEKFVRTFDSFASLIGGVLMLGVVVSAPFLLAYSCDSKKREETQKAQQKADLEESFRKAREAEQLRSLLGSGSENGFYPIGRASELAVGVTVYQKALVRVEGPRGLPTPIGEVKEVGVDYVVLKRGGDLTESLSPEMKDPSPKPLQTIFRNEDFAGGRYVTLVSPELMLKLKEKAE